MAITKFHERNIALFSKTEATSGTAVTTAAADATPVTTLSGGFTFDTSAFQFLGDSLSRDEYTYQKDIYGELSAEIMQPVLGAVATGTVYTVDSAGITAGDLFQACGGNFTAVGASTTAAIAYDNYTATTKTVSIEYKKSSGDAASQQTYPFFGCIGTVDISANIGEIPKLKFTMKGNAGTATNSPTVIVPDYANQMSNIVAPVKMASIITAKIVEITDTSGFVSGPTVTAIAASTTEPNTWTASAASGIVASLGAIGSIRPIKFSGITGATTLNNIIIIAEVVSDTAFKFYYPATGIPAGTIVCTKSNALGETLSFSTLSATNFFAFDFTRYLTGSEEGFAKAATPTDLSITVLEAPVGDATYFVPDQTEVSRYYAIKLKFGTAAGKYVTYQWDKTQMSNIKEGKVGNYFGRDITFRNTGKTVMMLS